MRKIRIGKDIEIRWSITTNGAKEPLAGRDLHLVISNAYSGNIPLPFVISDDDPTLVVAIFRGADQKSTGKYRLTLWENFGKDGQTAVDYCEAFSLVATTCEESDADPGNLETVTVDLGSGDLQLLTGDGGSVADAPMDGCHYGRRNGDWEKVVGSESIRNMVVLTQQEYDEMSAHDDRTLYIIR